MQYILIENWDKFQQYKDRRPTWIKLRIEIIEEFDAEGEPKKFFRLSDVAKLTFIALACLRANYNGKIPYPNDKWLKARLGLEKISIKPLESAGFIRVVQEPYANRTPSIQSDTESLSPEREKEREREKEGDVRDNNKKKKYGAFKHILLSTDELKSLRNDFGDVRLKTLIKMLDEGIEMKGYKYKNFSLALRKWAATEGIKKRKKSEIEADAVQACLDIIEKTPKFEREDVMEKLIDNYGKKAAQDAMNIIKYREE